MCKFFSCRLCGPNTEMAWNKAGARGFTILARVPPQTALAIVADKAAELAQQYNSKLDEPSKTVREQCRINSDEENCSTLVTSDPVQIKLSDQPTKLPVKAILQGKEPGAELITKSKKRFQFNNMSHSTTKIQQLYNSHNRPGLSPKNHQFHWHQNVVHQQNEEKKFPKVRTMRNLYFCHREKNRHRALKQQMLIQLTHSSMPRIYTWTLKWKRLNYKQPKMM